MADCFDVIEARRVIASAYNRHPDWATDPDVETWLRQLGHLERRVLLAAVDRACADCAHLPTVRDILSAIGDRAVEAGIGADRGTGRPDCARCSDGVRRLCSNRPEKAYTYAVACNCEAGRVRQGQGMLAAETAVGRVHPDAIAYLTGTHDPALRRHESDTHPESSYFRWLRPEELQPHAVVIPPRPDRHAPRSAPLRVVWDADRAATRAERGQG